ncbi:uncharacterized protein LOC121739616 [Aricia agestis]|nr:uncharacterized protein LOC121739616 [Aricia agestis]
MSSEDHVQVPSTSSIHSTGNQTLPDQTTPMELHPDPEYLLSSISNALRPATPLESTDNFDDDFVILPEEGQKFEECSGRRIVDIGYFFKQLKEMDHESLFKCNNSHLLDSRQIRGMFIFL